MKVRANLTIGADGRHSVVRERAGLQVIDLGAPMDVFWMRLSRRSSDPAQTFGHVEPGKIFVMLDREDYWQCAYVILKAAVKRSRAKGWRLSVKRLPRFPRFWATAWRNCATGKK